MRVSAILRLAIDELGRAPGIDMKVWPKVRDSVPIALAQEAVVEAAMDLTRYSTVGGWDKLREALRHLDELEGK